MPHAPEMPQKFVMLANVLRSYGKLGENADKNKLYVIASEFSKNDKKEILRICAEISNNYSNIFKNAYMFFNCNGPRPYTNIFKC